MINTKIPLRIYSFGDPQELCEIEIDQQDQIFALKKCISSTQDSMKPTVNIT